MTVVTIADIAGAHGPAQIASSGLAKWVRFSCTGTGAARVGDANTSSSQGVAVSAGTSIEFPVDSSGPFMGYGLALIYAYVPSGATLSITYGVA